MATMPNGMTTGSGDVQEHDDKPDYEPGDCVAVELGAITLRDGRVVNGVVLTFPVGPPKLPFSCVWDGTPLTLSIKQ